MQAISQPATPSSMTFPEAPTRRIADYASGIAYADLPADVTHRVKLTLVATIGVTLAAGASPLGRKVAQAARALGPGEQCTVFARGGPASASGAAMANG